MNKKGFTLVELLAVIAILALLVVIALPNVLKMFNNAKKDIFLTETKNVYKEISKKYISESMRGNKISTISNTNNKLDIESNGLTYKIKLDSKGVVKSFQVSNDTYCISGAFKSINELTVDKITEGKCDLNIVKEIAGTLRKDFYEVSGQTNKGIVKSLTFYSDDREIEGADVYDVSQEGNNSVRMYMKKDETDSRFYNINIVGNGLISLPEDSSRLFLFGEVAGGIISPLRYYTTIPVQLDLNDSIDSSKVTNMREMFAVIGNETIDLSCLDTSKVTNMSNMFAATDLKSLDLSTFDTSNVTDMFMMFYLSFDLTTLNLSNFNTSKVTNMGSMFEEAKSLISLDLSSFDTSNVTNMAAMFEYAEKLEKLNVSSFNTSKVTNMSNIFFHVKSLKELDLSNFDTSNVRSMWMMFCGMTNLKTLNISSFNTKNVTDMGSMFSSSSSLTILDLSNFDTSKVTDTSNMFEGMSSLTTLKISNLDIRSVIEMREMFAGMTSIEVLDLSSFNTSKVKRMDDMFKDCTKLKTIYVSDKFTIDGIDSYYGNATIFGNNPSLVGGSGTKYSSSKIDKTYARIDGGTSKPGYFTAK